MPHTIQEDESCCIYHELLSACQDPKIPATVAACFQVPHLLYYIGISFNILDQESWIIMSCSYSGVSKKFLSENFSVCYLQQAMDWLFLTLYFHPLWKNCLH